MHQTLKTFSLHIRLDNDSAVEDRDGAIREALQQIIRRIDAGRGPIAQILDINGNTIGNSKIQRQGWV